MFQTKVLQKIKTHIFCSVTFFPPKIVPFKWKNIVQSRTGHRWQYGACALHTWGYTYTLRIRNAYYCHGKISYMNAPQCDVICTLPVLFRNNLALYHVMYEAQRSGGCALWLDCTAHTCAPCAYSPPLINLNPTKSSGFLPSSPVTAPRVPKAV